MPAHVRARLSGVVILVTTTEVYAAILLLSWIGSFSGLIILLIHPAVPPTHHTDVIMPFSQWVYFQNREYNNILNCERVRAKARAVYRPGSSGPLQGTAQ